MEVTWPGTADEEAEYVIDLCKRADAPMAAAVIGGRPASDAFSEIHWPVQG